MLGWVDGRTECIGTVNGEATLVGLMLAKLSHQVRRYFATLVAALRSWVNMR